PSADRMRKRDSLALVANLVQPRVMKNSAAAACLPSRGITDAAYSAPGPVIETTPPSASSSCSSAPSDASSTSVSRTTVPSTSLYQAVPRKSFVLPSTMVTVPTSAPRQSALAIRQQHPSQSPAIFIEESRKPLWQDAGHTRLPPRVKST